MNKPHHSVYVTRIVNSITRICHEEIMIQIKILSVCSFLPDNGRSTSGKVASLNILTCSWCDKLIILRVKEFTLVE